MWFVLFLAILGWALTLTGYVFNYLNTKNFTEDKNRAALICFGTAFVLFMVGLVSLIVISI